VADFQSDSRCANFRDKPLSAGLLAGWSSPIVSHGGEVKLPTKSILIYVYMPGFVEQGKRIGENWP